MFYFWPGATAALVPGFLCQSGRRRPENVSILSSLLTPWQSLFTHVNHVFLLEQNFKQEKVQIPNN